MKQFAVLAVVLALPLLLGSLVNETEAETRVGIDVDAPMPRVISAFNLFADPARQIPNPGVVPYDLNTPLFTDYAYKRRFVWVPDGTAATYVEDEVFEFPVGTVIAKTFSYHSDINDLRSDEKIIETRILWHKPTGWIGLPYIWNEDVTEANLAVAGGRTEVSWKHYHGEEMTITYHVPNMNQCKQCHENQEELKPIGPKARHLNKDFPYDTGMENQLAHWVDSGLLEGAPDTPADAPRAAVWDDPGTGTIELRARAWLDINCAHCHNPKGPAFTSGLDLTYHQTDPHRFGVMKPPVAAGRGSGGHRFGIEPGEPEKSIVVHRMESEDPGVMMPTLGRALAHTEGVDLVRQWIAEMEPPA